MSGGLGIISGSGDLPRLIAEACQKSGRLYRVVVLKDNNLDWLDGHPLIEARLEKHGKIFKTLHKEGCESVVFAGAMARPNVNPVMLDGHGAKLMGQILAANRQGDDQSLRIILAYYEAQGFKVEAAQDIVDGLVPVAGVLTKTAPSNQDKKDAERAFDVVNGLGALDLGQGAVISRGVCLGLETAQGTDAMLGFVAENRQNFPPDAAKGKGVLVKAPKPDQDLRVDLPAIGIDTVRNVHAAGLAGVVIAAGGVMILGRAAVIAEADKLGIFVWVRGLDG